MAACPHCGTPMMGKPPVCPGCGKPKPDQPKPKPKPKVSAAR